jgi:hypothetical protein
MLDIDRASMKNRQVGDLEYALFASLNQVEPDPAFLTRVRSRIETPPTMVLEVRTFWEVYVIVASGLFLGAILLWLVQRGRK